MSKLEQLSRLVLDLRISYSAPSYWVHFVIEGQTKPFCGAKLEEVINRAWSVATAYGPERCKIKT